MNLVKNTSPYYIEQNMKQTSDIKNLFDDTYWYFEEKKKNIIPITVDELLSSNNKRYMIVAEPGYGKTRLLKEIAIRYDGEAFFIDAKRIKNELLDSIKKCKYFDTQDKTEEQIQTQKFFKCCDSKEIYLNHETIICIDALDEVSYDILCDLFEKIDEFILDYHEVKIFLSCRNHHLQKLHCDISSFDFKYVMLKPFMVNK